MATLAVDVGTRARARQIVRRPRLLLLLATIGVLLALSITLIGFSSAAFTASSVDPGSHVTAGGLRLALAPAAEILDGTELAPGVTRTGTITVTNELSAATVELSVADLQQVPAGAALDAVLDVQVVERSPTEIVHYSGKLRDLHGVPVGTIGAGAFATFDITISWPVELDDPSRQGATASFAFEWSAVST